MRLERLPIKRSGMLDQQLWVVRSQGLSEPRRRVFKGPGLDEEECGGCDGGTGAGKH